MSRKRILIPLGPESKDLKAVYHGLALVERVQAKAYIVFFNRKKDPKKGQEMIKEACQELINSACEDGLEVSYHITMDDSEDELLNIIEKKRIDLIVISHSETRLERKIKRILPLISCQVVQVKTRNNINFIQ